MTSRTRRFAVAILAIAAISDVGATQSDERGERNRGRSKELTILPAPRPVTTTGIQVPATPLQVAEIRVRLRLVAPAPGTWTITVSNLDGTTNDTFDAARFEAGEAWSTNIPGGVVRVRLTAAGTPPQVVVDGYASTTLVQQPQGLIGNDDTKAIDDPAVPMRVRQWGRSVARIRFMSDKQRREDVCSGFLTGPTLLMTNQHCISSAAEARSAEVMFGYDSPAATPKTFTVTRIEATNRLLDYTLVRLSADAGAFGQLQLSGRVVTNMRLVMIQHPAGQPKRVAIPPNCAVDTVAMRGVDNQLTDFGHSCDTLSGSSGSPAVIDQAGNGIVVGLHHWNWEPGAPKLENQAVHSYMIADDLKAKAIQGQIPQALVDQVVARPN